MFRAKQFGRNGMSLHRRLRVEEFEPRLNLSAISFISHEITTAVDNVFSVYPSDVDGDGDLDVFSASKSLRGGNLAWYENTNGKGNFGQQQVISTELGRPVRAVDIDGDGDNDVFSVSHDTIFWYENTDGKGTFGEQRVITTTAIGVQGVDAADVDGDGDNDVLLALYSDNKVTWYENTDGKGTFGEQRVISSGVGPSWMPRFVQADDMDGDGDLDVMFASRSSLPPFGIKIAWHENTDGKGAFGEQQVVTTNAGGSKSVHVGDIDGDSDLDVLATSWGRKLTWYENIDGNGAFGAPQVIGPAVSSPEFSESLYAGDIDGDGDLDAITASYRSLLPGVLPGAYEIAWYENTDGKGTFGEQQVVSIPATEKIWSVNAGDMDGDGDLDVLSGSCGSVAWHENLLTHAGDANHDGVFNQLDIVQVLQANKYLTGEPATFEEGDWNEDGVFDQLDIVAALQTGNYLQGPHAASSLAKAVIQVTGSDDVHVELVDELLLSDLGFAVL